MRSVISILILTLGIIANPIHADDDDDDGPIDVKVKNKVAIKGPVDIGTLPDVNIASLPAIEANIDTSTPLNVQGVVNADVQGTVNIGNSPTVFDGDHPAMTPFVMSFDSGLKEGSRFFPAFRIDSDPDSFIPPYCDGAVKVITHVSGFISVIKEGARVFPPAHVILEMAKPQAGFRRHYIKPPTEGATGLIVSQDMQMVVTPDDRELEIISVTLPLGDPDQDLWESRASFLVSGYCFSQ